MVKSSGTEAHRGRILKVALALLTKQGREAVTTRNVAEAAKVQPPVIYRLFGDKNGLLEAVAAHGFTAYLTKKRPPESNSDPVEALRAGWDLHVEFGLANPELYRLMYADPQLGSQSLAAQQSFTMLEQHMHRVAAAGRLRVSVARACDLYHAAAVGTILVLLSKGPEQRDLELSASARAYVLNGITRDPAPISVSTLSAAANQMALLLASHAEERKALSNAECVLLSEWLKRLVGSATNTPGKQHSRK